MASHLLSMGDVDLVGRRLLVREDFNVPISNSRVTSDARLKAALPTLELAMERGARTIICSHLGRPEEGQFDSEYSLGIVAEHLSGLLGKKVPLLTLEESGEVLEGEVALLENVRFLEGEKNNSKSLSKKLANLCDVFVMDAFGSAHRAHASTCGVARYASVACAGPLLLTELESLEKALEDPARPLIAIVGGSKVSTKLAVIEALAEQADCIFVGGGIANTFIAAEGVYVGNSLYEEELMETAARIAAKVEVPLPSDVMVAESADSANRAVLRHINDIRKGEMILDLGPSTAREFSKRLANAGTVLWNGPVGVFEKDQFGEGTRALAEAIAESPAYSIAGGGDTLAAIEKYEVASGVSYISTGGGAFLEFVEGKKLPAVEVLEIRAKE